MRGDRRARPGDQITVAWREWVCTIPPDLRIAAIERQMGHRGIGRRFCLQRPCLAGDLAPPHHIVGGHHHIRRAGRLNDHQFARLIDRADVALLRAPACAGSAVFAASTGFQLL